MVRRALLSFAVALACRATSSPSGQRPNEDIVTPPRAATTPTTVLPTPIPDGPVLVVHSRVDTAITIYGAYLVDRAGELGTRALWPHPSDCPGVELPPRTLDGRGVLLLPPPTEAYVDDSCTPSKLPDGEYVLRLDSGYGENLYAAAALTLPLSGPVELEMKSHERGPPCDASIARRAARLTFAAASPLAPEWTRECDIDRARCGTLPLESTLPPAACTITLHERLLRVERAAADDTPRVLEAWADSEAVFVQRPELRRTSASRVVVDGKPIVIAGETSHERHEHGGEAARIGSAGFVAHNPHARPLRLRVRSIEFLTDSDCNLPREVHSRPKPDPDAPTELPPGRSELVVGFAPQAAYQAHCDRFATRVTFEVEGKRVAVAVEHEVMRFEPMHR